MIKKLILGIFTIILFINFETAYSEIFIKAKVNNQIITNFDIKNEKNYLLALNPNLKNLPSENLNRYAIDSAINEKVKKIEIEKKYQILENNNIIQKIIKQNLEICIVKTNKCFTIVIIFLNKFLVL